MDLLHNNVPLSANETTSADTTDRLWSITTSIRSDPQLCDFPENSRYYMLAYHQARMLGAAHCFDWPEAEKQLQGVDGIRNLINTLGTYEAKDSDQKAMFDSKSYKIRVLMDRRGQFTVSASEVPEVKTANLFPKSLSARGFSSEVLAWRVFISPTQTVPTTFTKHKTTHRVVYERVRRYIPAWALNNQNPVNIGITPEILLVNTQDDIMEGSITTPYFFRGGRWVTPPATSGGNIGTTRRWALESGLCVEEVVRTRDVQIGEHIWLSNGVRGWGLGVVAERQNGQEQNSVSKQKP